MNATDSGISGVIAGGGGGSVGTECCGYTSGAGGSGGGGGGSALFTGQSGQTNTGSGGGGNGSNIYGGTGGPGGSGLILLRWSATNDSNGIPINAIGGTNFTSGGYTYRKFTSSGTFTI